MDASSPVNVHTINPTAHVRAPWRIRWTTCASSSHRPQAELVWSRWMVRFSGGASTSFRHIPFPSTRLTSIPSRPLDCAMKSERRPDNRYEKKLGQASFPALASKAEKTPSALLKDLKEARRLGYASFDQENLDNILVVGVVVRDTGGQAIAAIRGARNQLQGPSRENLCRLVTAAAERISRRLGAHDKTDPVNLNKSKTQERCAQC
jgi:hypothetical protein